MVLGSSVNASSSSVVIINYGEMTDARDNQKYKTVVIGSQTWMAENLNYGNFLFDSGTDSLYQLGAQKFCYDNQSLTCSKEGGLYQWHTAMNFGQECIDGSFSCSDQVDAGHQGICPSGWHIPNGNEWDVLAAEMGGSSVAGGKMKVANFGGTDDFGLSISSSGYRRSFGGFINQETSSYYWVVGAPSVDFGHFLFLYKSENHFVLNSQFKTNGFSVRCLKD